jgi:hypothetical protein
VGTKYKNLHILIPNTAPLSGPFPNFVIATTPQVMQTRAADLVKLDEALLYAMRQFESNPSAFAKAAEPLGPHNNYSSGLLEKIDTRLAANGYWGVNGGINMASFDKVVKLYYSVTGLKPTAQLTSGKQLVDTGFLAKALATLGVQKNAEDVPDWMTSSAG